MSILTTKYMGIELKNPLIVGACNLSADSQHLQKMEQAGAAAVVYKSLFEEQIQLENFQFEQEMAGYNDRNAEMQHIFPDLEHAGPKEYLYNLEEAVKSVNIPVFASLNAVYDETWPVWAAKLEQTGVAGIELNFYHASDNFEEVEQQLIARRVEVIRQVKQVVKIPVAAKLSPYYANPLNVIKQMDGAGANGFVLFNRLFQPDIDVDREEHIYPYNLSSPDDHRLALRYAGLLHGNIKGNVCSSNGVYDGRDVVRMLLAGADTVQVVSTLYKHGIQHVARILTDLEAWMNTHGYHSLSDFRGKLSQKMLKDPFAYKRSQYVDILMKSDKIFRNYPVI